MQEGKTFLLEIPMNVQAFNGLVGKFTEGGWGERETEKGEYVKNP